MAVKKFRESFWPQRKHPAWEEAAKQIDGRYEKDSTFFSSTERSQIIKQVFDWPLTLFENYNGNNLETVLAAPFLNPNHLKLDLSRDVIFRLPGFLRRTQFDELGDPGFMKHYSIKNGDKDLVKQLIDDPDTRRNLLKQPFTFRMKVKDRDSLLSNRTAVQRLELIVQRTIRNPKHIESLFHIAEKTLLLLNQWPSIAEAAPAQRTLQGEPQQIHQTLQSDLNETLHFFAAHTDRLQDSLEAHFEDPEGLVTGQAKLRVEIPTLPEYTGHISLDAPHPVVTNPLLLSRNASWINKISGIINDSTIRNSFDIESQDDHTHLYGQLKESLSCVSEFNARLEWRDTRCHFQVHDVPGDQTNRLVYTLLEMWRKSIRTFMGFGLLGEESSKST